MKIFNFGSLNIDHVYTVDHFVQPGETLASLEFNLFAGGKGLNQSIALARAGADVAHVGRIGPGGEWLKKFLKDEGVDVSMVAEGDEPTGHAIIQVDKSGENSIITYGGANRALDECDVEKLIDAAEPGDFVLMQNEASCLEALIKKAVEKGMFIVYNPAPLTPEVQDYPLEDVDMIILNETEGKGLTGIDEPDEIVASLRLRYPSSKFVLTLGAKGARFSDKDTDLQVDAELVEAVDSTGAGDTFIGYLLAEVMNGSDLKSCLETACRASAICVQRNGAADSIPIRAEIEA